MAVKKQIMRGCPGCGHDVYLLDSVDEDMHKVYIMCCINDRCGIGTPPCKTPRDAMLKWQEQAEYVKREKARGNWPH